MTNNTAEYNFEGIVSTEMLDFAFPVHNSSEIKVIGVGGGGSNAINHMYDTGVEDVQFIICNTDEQALLNSQVPYKIQLGKTLTGGRGAGSNPAIGREAAIESMDEILELIGDNTDMVFIAAGMGGGTGTGAAPVIAKKIKEQGILTVAIVTAPFSSEIGDRMKHATKGIEEISQSVDALIVIENEKLNINYAELPLSEAFKKVDEVLATAAQSIVEIIKVHGAWNVDFNDVKTIMTDSSVALMGSGIAEGDDRAKKAVEEAINYPLLNNNNISGAKNILINIVSGVDEILVKEHQQICEYVQNISGREAEQFIIGTARDLSLGSQIKVTIIATGFNARLIYDFWQHIEKAEPANKIEETIEPENLTDTASTEVIKEEQNKEEPKEIKEEKKSKKKKEKKPSRFQTIINFFDEDPK